MGTIKTSINKDIVQTVGSKEWENAIKKAIKENPNFKVKLYPACENVLDPKDYDVKKRYTPSQIKNLNRAKQILLGLQGAENVDNSLLN